MYCESSTPLDEPGLRASWRKYQGGRERLRAPEFSLARLKEIRLALD
jgi:hypothetical protein